MKFHHLAKHGQFAATLAAQQHQQQQQQLQRDASPNNNKQQATSLQKQQVDNLMSDEDDEDFNDQQGYYDAIDQHNQHQHQLQHQQQQQQASNNSQQLDASGFLMDKNKKLFPQKLWELIHNPSIQHCLRWSQDGQRVYLNRNEFEAYYLKTPNNQFHTQKAISFVRQMNMYGFRKVDDCYYENDNFRRDRQHLLRNMIRRHPNKGLFVGLDHHQLAAAAAAQQALQVNQQLQQLEHQHKHRTEQALRINSYLNSHHHHHRFHQSALAAAAVAANGHVGAGANLSAGNNNHQFNHLHNHSSPFEQMSSQLAQTVNHLSQQQQQQLQGATAAAAASLAANSVPCGANLNLNQQQQHRENNNNNNNQSAVSMGLQPKKSRLLSNFYASAIASGGGTVNNNNNNNNNNSNSAVPQSVFESSANQLIHHNQDSMHSTSSVDTEPSQCSSVVNSGSAGSPQPNSPSVLHQRLAALGATGRHNHHHQSSSASTAAAAASIRAAVLAAAGAHPDSSLQSLANKFASSAVQHAATDLSSQTLASQQAALHQTLVRSLLQLKQQHPQDLLASLQQHQQQQQNPRSLLESLASLSSAGTGSIVDPASNSPTERNSATPPSEPGSPGLGGGGSGRRSANDGMDEHDGYHAGSLQYMDNNNIALDLASKSSSMMNGGSKSVAFHKRSQTMSAPGARNGECDGLDPDDELEREVDEETEVEDENETSEQVVAGSPLDGAKKVRRFLDNQMVSPQKKPPSSHGKHSRSSSYSSSEAKGVDMMVMQVRVKREEQDEDEELSPNARLDTTTNENGSKPLRKRVKLSNNNNNDGDNCSTLAPRSPLSSANLEDEDDDELSSLSKSLIIEICDRRGDQLDAAALREAARYTECFLEILLEDAALIAGHSLDNGVTSHQEQEQREQQEEEEKEAAESEGANEAEEEDEGKGGSSDEEFKSKSRRASNVVDTSSLSLALKLIPSKLLAAIQLQVNNIKSQSLSAC